ncbi:hypothetical protein [Actinoplanes sichuanensis]|uniref:Uncharacterized protein n=1 Tax=Actinoplanes sichuanensis TaxID=512349 RepID=A0ABW4A2I6_9ACTN
MSPSIGSSGTSSWTSYAAWMRLQNQRRPESGSVGGAQREPAAADPGTVARTEPQRVVRLRPGHRLDVTV